MRRRSQFLITLLIMVIAATCLAEAPNMEFRPGTTWHDSDGAHLNAHAGTILAMCGSISTDPSNMYFGAMNGSNKPSQVNAPRTIQLSGKIYF